MVDPAAPPPPPHDPYAPPRSHLVDAAPRQLADRPDLVRVMGALTLLLALGSLAVGGCGVLGQLAAGQTGVVPAGGKIQLTTLATFALYLPVIALVGAVGVGLLRLQRWAARVAQVGSILALAFGVAGVLGALAQVPEVMRQLEQQGAGAPPPEAQWAIGASALGCTACLLLGLPGVYAFVFSRPSVWATVERRDPRPSWADRCPPTVLGVVGVYAFSALFNLQSMILAVVPVFGTFVTGPAAQALIALATLASAGLAWGLYELRRPAWAAALGLNVLVGASLVVSAVTLSPRDWLDALGRAGLSSAELKLMAQGQADFRASSLVGAAACLIVGAVLVGVRRHFDGGGASGAGPAEPA